MADTTWTFRIQENEYAKYASLAASETLDPELCKNYSETAIIKAKQLKAKHGSDFTDGYYLDYAKSLEYQEIIGTSKEIHKKRVIHCEIKDVDWAGYSYEEILAMEKDGYKIPEDILLWAHAQQEADVTDYVVVSDATAVSDNTTDSVGEPQDELGHLQTKAKQSVTKTELALEEATKDIEEYNFAADKAEQIKKKEQFFYKAILEDITKDKQEWERLKEKKEDGKISKFEEIKLKKLSKKFDNQEGGILNKIKQNNTDLEKFLTSLDGLNNDISENLTLAKDTIKAGKELSEYEKTYNQSQLPVATSGNIFDGNGQTSDTLYEVKSEELSELAIEKGTELEEFSNSLSVDLTTGKNAKLTEFASDYTARSAELKNDEETKQEDSETSQQSENNKKEKVQNYDVLMNFSYPNSIIATATTLLSTGDVTARDIRVGKDNKDLRKELSIANKDSQQLAKESSEAEEKLTENQAKEEVTRAELETIQQEAPTTELKDEEKPETIGDEQTIKTEPETQPTNDKNTNKKEELLNELAQQEDENKSIKDLVKKATRKSAQSTSKGEKLTRALTSENNNLETRTNNNEKVSEKTTVVGAGTIARGFMDTALGTTMYTTGASLISFPPTFSQGIALIILGTELQLQGEKEITYGSIAMGTGIAGTVVSEIADGTNKSADRTIKEANQIYKNNNRTIKEASQNIGENTSEVQDQQVSTPSSESTTEDTSTTTQTDEIPTNEIPTDETSVETTETQPETPIEENTDLTTNTEDSEQNTEQTNEPSEQLPTENQTPVDDSNTENPTTKDQNVDNENNDELNDEPKTTEENQETQPKQQEKKEPSVDIEFSAPNAVKATGTTINATADMIKAENQMKKLSKTVETETKQSQKLIKNIDAESAKAVIEHQKNLAESETISAQHTTAQNELQTAQTQDQADGAQQTMTNLSTQLNTTIEKDSKTNTDADKTISNSIQQLSKFRNNTKIMNKELPTLDNTISNQLEVSTKTTAVGIGTTGVGVLNSYTGTGLMLSGMILMSNPFTYSMGVAQLLAGEVLLTKGISEVTAGTVATVTGASGITANAITQLVSKDSDEVLDAANEQNDELEEKAGESSEDINPDAPIQENSATDTEQNIDTVDENETELETETEQTTITTQMQEDNEIVDITQLSASASANANITETVFTDDKADKKLSRFNAESIIESKKKMKKVQAVSASSGGKA